MPDLWMDVDTALSEVPVNKFPLLDDTDFKTREISVAYNAAGMDLVWNFLTTGGAFTQTAVTPTTAGDYDWTNQGKGMYTIEIPASGGASINNDTEGFGWFTGIVTGVLPWTGPTIGFRASGLNDTLIDSAYSATRGLAGTALPAAAADAAGGLPISDGGGLDMDAILVDTNSLNDTKVPDTISLANINAEVDTALTDVNLDHLVGTATGIPAIPAGTYLDQIMDDGTATFDRTTDSLQAIRDRGDAAWTTGAGGTPPDLLQSTTIATLASQTSFTLTAGSADDDAYNGAIAVITDQSTSTQKAVGIVSDYTGSTKTVTLQTDPGIFTMAVGDSIAIVATDLLSLVYTATRAGYLDNLNGHTAQTGDNYARLGAPAGASVSADIAAIEAQTDDIGVAGAGLTAIPWNAAWDAEVESEATDALNAYDPPTNTEMEARTLATASYATAANQTTILARIGSFTGSGVNTILGFFQALMRSDATTPSDVGGTYDDATDSLQAIRDRGDSAWTTGAGGDPPELLQNTTIATLASQTSFTLTAGSADDDAYNGAMVVVTDQSTSTQKAVGKVSDYTGSTKTVTLEADPGIFTMAVGDTIDVIAFPALNDISTAQVNAEVIDVLRTDTISELSGVPAASPDLHTMILWMYMMLRNKLTASSTQQIVHNDAGTGIATSTLSESGGTFTRGEFS